MKIAVPKETYPGERRVAVIPASLTPLAKLGFDVHIETGAGSLAGFSDAAYSEKGAKVESNRTALISGADVILQVRGFGVNPGAGAADLPHLHTGQTLIAFLDPLGAPQLAQQLAATGVTSMAMELIPRITRAQSMDALSSMATVAGYKAVLLAADHLPRMFPMFMTAAGTVAPARVFVVGAGVAGLQAISTAKRLGAVVSAYDVRPAVKEQVESLGGKFVEFELDTSGAEGKGGYAQAMDEAFYRRQREMMARVVAENDVVITTAAVPGKRAPVLITAEMIRGMIPGSVIVDIAAEQGGNCELTKPGEIVTQNDVTILGHLNLASTIPYHASQMYARNLQTLLSHLTKDKSLVLNLEDEITREILVTRDGKVVHPRLTGAGERQS
ncbi:MAG: Re/Si-specific NAD(P)(+) transhydrogenase subunit alpha [Candidatus Zixiibacteriota bacterium]